MNRVIGGLVLFLSMGYMGGSLLPPARGASTPVVLESASGQAMFRANPAHTGAYSTSGVAHLHGVLWAFHTGGAVKSSPAIVGNRAYIGSSDGSLYALASKTGHVIWRVTTGAAISSSPAVMGGRVFVTSADGYLYTVYAATGRLVWRLQIATHPAAYDQWDYYISSPVVAVGLVYVGSCDGALYAVSLRGGHPLWIFRPRAARFAPISASPALADGHVYIGTMAGTLYALNARTGTLTWIFQAGDALQSSPTIVGHTLFIGSRDTRLYAIDTITGRPRWTVTLASGSWIVSSPAVAHGVVYMGTPDQRSLLALDAVSGTQLWDYATAGNVFSSPALGGQTVYVGSGNAYADQGEGYLYAIDTQTGQLRWQFQAHIYVWSSPVIADGIVYIGSDDHALYALH